MPNPSFEYHGFCPGNYGQIIAAVPWFQPNISGSSTDYFNSCAVTTGFLVPANNFGFQQAKTGTAYAGIFSYALPSLLPHYREYLEIALKESLTPAVTYCVSFYISLAEKVAYATDGIGAYISTLAVSSPNLGILPFQPQLQNPKGNIILDTANWVLIQGDFIASGGEKYITIGNFRNDSLTDTLIFNPASPYHYSYYYIDDVSVIEGSCSVGMLEQNKEIEKIVVYPNPTKGIIHLQNTDEATIEVIDASGRRVLSDRNKKTINLERFENGIYFIDIINQSGDISHNRIILNK